MPPPNNGNERLPFAQLIAVETLSSNQYRSKALAFGPGDGNRTYGGHVYMQACYAAAQTIGKEFVLHNVTGWFLLAGKAHERFTYNVRIIRDGGYCTRGVDVVQESDPSMCFTCICSFKKPEKPTAPQMNVRQHLDISEEFNAAIGTRAPQDHAEMPGIDAPWFWKQMRQKGNDPFPGLDLRKVDMTPHNASQPPLERRSLKYYSALGELPPFAEDPNMHLCAHLYASDRNSLFVISNHLSINDNYAAIASLSHTVIFHTTAAEELALQPARWFCQEAWAGGAKEGRGMHQSRLWGQEGRVHVATTVQDGMVRVGGGGGEGKDGFSPGRGGRL